MKRLAVQTGLALPEDMNGEFVNDVNDMSPDNRMQNMHICVFPLETETVVLAFYHKRDRRYRKLRHQFNVISAEKALQYLNWLIFKHTENYFISKSISEEIESNSKLRELSQENNGVPSFGIVKSPLVAMYYKGVQMDEIPNFLSEKFALH